MHFSSLLALAGAVSSVSAVTRGFNYGSTFTDGSVKVQQDFVNEFNRAKNLPGTSGFTSARLYTMIQGGTANTVISAIPAAISTNTGLLLGLWASAGQASFDNEITALKNAINQYGTAFTNLIEGISVGSEDLYRISPTGIINKSGLGANPDDLVSYINQVRSAIQGTAASGKSVGHVDTWTAWVNGSNSAVINAVDWLGFDGYPYFQNTQSNGIENGANLFFESYNATVGAAAGKPVWVTETGWPVSGPTENLAVASTQNAETYWQDVACRILGNINTYWYTLQDAYPTTPAPSFGIVPTDLNAAPLYDLTCKAGTSGSSSSAVSSASSQQSTSVASATQPSTAAVSTTVSQATEPGVESTLSSSVIASSAAAATSAASASSVATSVATGGATGGASVGASSGATGVATGSATGGATIQTSVPVVSGSQVGSSSGQTHTTYSTTLITITSCPGGSCSSCTTASATAPAATASVATSAALSSASSPASTLSVVVSSAAPSASSPVSTASAVVSSAASSASSSAQTSSSSCPANLNGPYEYPHLIVPVDSANPSKAYGTSYNGTISSSVSSIFNFDIPASDAGKTCSLVFLLPQKSQLETSDYSFNGKGGLQVTGLSSPATVQTSYSSVPAANGLTGAIPSVAAGNSYVVLTEACPAGQRVGFEFASTNGLEINFFQDYNPSPLGVYITVC